MNARLKNLLSFLGFGLSIFGVAFLIWRLLEYSNQYDFSRVRSSLIFYLPLLSTLSGVAGLFLAFAWQNVLSHLGMKPPIRWTIKCYGLTQTAKYLPGNIFQFAGRQAMGMTAGLPGKDLAASFFWEIVLLLLAGTTFTWFAALVVLSAFSEKLALVLWIITVIGLGCLVAKITSALIMKAFLWLVIYLTLSGSLFLVLLKHVSFNQSFDLETSLIILGSYIIAWLGGFLTPGAPAGVGVRELVLDFLLKGLVPNSDLTLALVLSRVVSVSGDLLFYFLVLVIRNEKIDLVRLD